jgi:phospholipase A-2-activating protein
VRVFTRDSSRQADAAAIQAFEEAVKSSAIPQQQLGEINKEKLPGPEFLQQKSGTKEGQVVMIREANGNVTAHQWSTATRQWISVGTVVDAVGSSGRKQDYLGQDYDYVFDVDIKEGAPPLKLPYNLSQNPYEAATKFLQDNELPIGYLDQVANFIVTNTRGATIGQSQAGDAPQQQQQQPPSGPDPFGIESRYRPGDASSTYAPQSVAGAALAAAARPKKLPQTSYLSLKQANLKTIQKKIEELNRGLIAGGSKDVSLNPSDLALLQELTGVLEPALTAPMAPATPTEAAAAAAAAAIPLVVRLVTLWPPAQRLPGLDLLRLVAAGAGGALASYTGPADETVVDILDRSGVFADAERPNNILLAVRVFVNLFESPEGRALAESHFDKVEKRRFLSLSSFYLVIFFLRYSILIILFFFFCPI